MNSGFGSVKLIVLIDGKLRYSRLTIVDAKCKGAKIVVRGPLMYGEDLLIVNTSSP
jgi:hypothetical protein